MKAWLERRWYGSGPPPAWLLPLSAVYGSIAARRRRRLQLQRGALPVPVIVVGNISIGGTGKTPFVIWLVQRLHDWGFSPGVISRGYGGRAPEYPLTVTAQTDAALCGDEPLLIALRTGAPVVVAPDRLAAARRLLELHKVDVVVADDGLQHYRLPRNREICVVDGRRGFGNGALLPAGPLREPPSRLREVDLLVVNGDGAVGGPAPTVRMQLQPGQVWSVTEPARRVPLPLASLRDARVHAVAGIGDPQRFFATLEAQGLRPIRHVFPDHHRYVAADLDFGDEAPVIMTEKDAVKCRGLRRAGLWALPVSAWLSAADEQRVRECCEGLTRGAAPHG